MSKKILIIGGTSGLGLELAKQYSDEGNILYVTGRKNPEISTIQYIPFSISNNIDETIEKLDKLISEIDNIDTVIYAAGFSQIGTIDTLSDSKIMEMINVGISVPALCIKRLKNRVNTPLNIILITSSSGYTPRKLEPIYASTKAALEMLGASLALDTDVGNVLVVAPSGMDSPFWDDTKDTSEYLDPEWVAERIIELFADSGFKYKYVKILRSPARVEIAEEK